MRGEGRVGRGKRGGGRDGREERGERRGGKAAAMLTNMENIRLGSKKNEAENCCYFLRYVVIEIAAMRK